MLILNKDFIIQLKEINEKINGQEDRIDMIYNYLIQFVEKEKKPRSEVGFKSK